MHFLVFKPTLKILTERSAHTDDLEKKAEDFLSQAKTKEEKYNKRMEETALQGKNLRERVLKSATASRNQIIDKARQQAAAHLSESRRVCEDQTDKARTQLESNATVLANEIYEKLLENNRDE